jgi:hypothetical protein
MRYLGFVRGRKTKPIPMYIGTGSKPILHQFLVHYDCFYLYGQSLVVFKIGAGQVRQKMLFPLVCDGIISTGEAEIYQWHFRFDFVIVFFT